MRLVPVLLSLSLVTACGISKDDHQRALDIQRQQLTTSANRDKAELERQLADAQARLSGAQGTSGQVAQLQRQVKVLTSALRAREAQIALTAKDVASAERLVKQSYDAAKAADLGASSQLSEAYDLIKQRKPAADSKLQEAANALSAATNS